MSEYLRNFAAMKIGTIDLGNRPLLLAPMEDVTDIGFRQMCKRFGAAMVYTEFVSADAIIRNIDSTLRKMVIDDRLTSSLKKHVFYN